MRNYSCTKAACYLGYATQAAVNNFAPLLFIVFTTELGLSLGQVTALIAVNFTVQLLTDFLSGLFADRIGYRPCIVLAHVIDAVGLMGLGLFPLFMPPFAGLLVAVILYAVGGGLIEVLVSPIVEACPTKNKKAEMSLLHSFYCWGAVAVIGLSTLFFALFGRGEWRTLACLWAILPAAGAVLFCLVPVPTLAEGGADMSARDLLRSPLFLKFALLILAAGAAELGMSQWASAFAERGLGVDKTAGDLAGPCLFAALMGLARVLCPLIGKKVSLRTCLLCSGILCAGCYLLAGLVQIPALALAGCAVCGFSVGMLWPGVFSLAAEALPRGGTAMFALLALGGDAGCLVGPSVVGAVTDASGGDIGTGLLVGILFPLLIVLLLSIPSKKRAA